MSDEQSVELQEEEQLDSKSKDFQENNSGEKLSTTESIAAKYGWNPDGKKSAEEYIEFALEKFPKRGEALTLQNKKLESKDGELSEMKAMLSELASHMDKQKDLAYKQALKDIDSRKKQAIAEGDMRQVDELEAEEKSLKPLPKAIEDFKRRNAEWIDSPKYEHRQMYAWLMQEDQNLGRFNLDPAQHAEELEAGLHRQFPDYFGAPLSKMQAVDSDSGSGVAKTNKKTFTFDDLTETQKNVATYLDKSGIKKKSEYIKQLVENGDLK